MVKAVFFTAALVCSLALTGCGASKKVKEGNEKIAQMNKIEDELFGKRIVINIRPGMESAAKTLASNEFEKMTDLELESAISSLERYISLGNDVLGISNSSGVEFKGDKEAFKRRVEAASSHLTEAKSVRTLRKVRAERQRDEVNQAI
jgi:hypothetical protein